jgi:hypothetical protein
VAAVFIESVAGGGSEIPRPGRARCPFSVTG